MENSQQIGNSDIEVDLSDWNFGVKISDPRSSFRVWRVTVNDLKKDSWIQQENGQRLFDCLYTLCRVKKNVQAIVSETQFLLRDH